MWKQRQKKWECQLRFEITENAWQGFWRNDVYFACHTLCRVLSLASRYPFFISSVQLHMLFFICSFLIRKDICSAGKYFYILHSTPLLRFVSFRFVSSPRYFCRRQVLIIQILPKPIFISHKWIFTLDVVVNRCSYETLILLK